MAAAREPGTVVLAGGTELLNWLRLGIADARPCARHLRASPGSTRIEPLPAAVSGSARSRALNDVAADARIARDWPAC